MTKADNQSRRLQQGVYGVLGHKIAYSQSPLIFRRVFDSLQWPAVYAQFDRSPRQLKQFVTAASDAGIVGFNVTQPYKVRIIEHLDACDRSAKTIGAVNTVTVTGNRLIGSNTDIDGVETALAPFRSELRDSLVVILGAGGAARAVAHALDRRFNVSAITVAVRSVAKGRQLVREINRSSHSEFGLTACSINKTALSGALSEATLLVNATPVGGSASPEQTPLPSGLALPGSLIVFDLIYAPRPTLLLKRARKAGCRTIDGWPMLVGQAEAAFRLWTGCTFPSKVRRELLSL